MFHIRRRSTQRPMLNASIIKSRLRRTQRLPRTLQDDVATLISEWRITSKDELKAVDQFIQASAALVNLPSFVSMKIEQEGRKHCVVCHASYKETDNHDQACIIPHLFDKRIWEEMDDWEGTLFNYESVCCGSAATLAELERGSGNYVNAAKEGQCRVGWHTDNVDFAEQDEVLEHNPLHADH